MKSKPITEIFLRVKGELSMLNNALTYCDKENVLHHRIHLNGLLRELERSLINIDTNIYMHKIVGNASFKIIERSQAMLYNASHFLSNCLKHQ